MSGSTVILALAGRGRDPVARVDGSITDSDFVETRRTLPVAACAVAANLGLVVPRRVLVDLIPAGQAVLDRVLPEVQQLITAVMGTPDDQALNTRWTT
jgi:hypothetical protein